MKNREKKKFFYSALFPFLFVLLISLVKGAELFFELSFVNFGILPRTLQGLKGILLAPLIHGDFNHLFNNSIPLLLLGWALFYFYRSIAFRIVFWSYLLAGFYTWISARHSYHIGASGLVYALFGFIFISGFIRKYIPLIALSFLVAFLYGSLVWGILPWEQGVSWEGHFWGLFVGFILAIYYRKLGPQKKVYQWEEEEEEEAGNISEMQGDSELESKPKSNFIEYVYHFVPKKKEEDEF